MYPFGISNYERIMKYKTVFIIPVRIQSINAWALSEYENPFQKK